MLSRAGPMAMQRLRWSGQDLDDTCMREEAERIRREAMALVGRWPLPLYAAARDGPGGGGGEETDGAPAARCPRAGSDPP